MKQCPRCNQTYNDDSLAFCLSDGAELRQLSAPQATSTYAPPRSTGQIPTASFPPQGQSYGQIGSPQGYGQQQAPQMPQTLGGTGLQPNVAATLSYVLTWITGVIFFLLEKQNRFVRFHAMQAILLGAAWTVEVIVFRFISTALDLMGIGLLTLLLIPVQLLFFLAFLILWIMCLIKAYQNQNFHLPILGNIADGIVDKQTNP